MGVREQATCAIRPFLFYMTFPVSLDCHHKNTPLSLWLLPGNGIAALHSVPTAIFCVLHCLQPRECLPESYGGVERTIAYSLALGGDTDTIACMAGAIAGAHYGIETVPQSWIRCCEGVEDADQYAERLYKLYHQSPLGGKGETGEQSGENRSTAANGTEKKTGVEWWISQIVIKRLSHT